MAGARGKAAFAAALLATLGACTQTEAPPAIDGGMPPAGLDSCGAAEAAGLIGGTIDDIAAAGLDRPVRVVPEGGLVVQDFQRARINFEFGPDMRVIRIFCG